MNKSMIMIGAVAMLLLTSCRFSSKTKERVTNINVELQDSVEGILQRHLTEYDAMDGVAIVMETHSGRIRAMVGLASEGDSTFLRADSLAGVGRSSALMRTVSMLAALNTDKVKADDKFDVGEGLYVVGKDTIFDHNWRRGGYGELTLRQTLDYSSDIGVVKAVDKAFPDKKDFLASVRKMSFGQALDVEGLMVDSCAQAADMPWYYYAMGFQEVSPIQMLALYNAIAKKSEIASPASIASIREMLEEVVAKGLAGRAMSDKVRVAGANGTIANKDNTLTADFCGYFPADKPQYTVLVSVHRKEIPASGGSMAGPIFKEIAELLVGQENAMK